MTLAIPGRITPTSLELPPNLSMDEWARVGETLKLMAGAVQFWVGDWFAYGETHYGEEAWQFLERSEKTLANWASVCRKIEPSRRREEVSFSVHAELAPLPPEEQERELERAKEEGWTVKQARQEVRGEAKNVETIDVIRCPKCEEEYPMSEALVRTVER